MYFECPFDILASYW